VSLSYPLTDLAKLEARTPLLMEIAYGWCSLIYGNRGNLCDWRSFLPLCLKIGFRHLDSWRGRVPVALAHTEHHRRLVDVVFEMRRSEAIADLLRAWSLNGNFSGPDSTLVSTCIERLVSVHNLVTSSPILRRSVLYFIQASYYSFGGTGAKELIELLGHLRVGAEEIEDKPRWRSLLSDMVRSSEGAKHLPCRYWKLLLELLIPGRRALVFTVTDISNIAESLIDAQEWEKLECWIGIAWMRYEPPGRGGVAEKDLEDWMVTLFWKLRTDAETLKGWMERWNQQSGALIPEPFERTCKRAYEAAQQRVPS
jgi:hypothetical protein